MESFDENRISGIMVRKVIGEAVSGAEQAELDRWLARSSHNREAYERFMSAGGRVERQRLLSGTDDDGFVAGVYAKMKRRRLRKTLLRGVASAAAIAGLAVGIYSGFFAGGGSAAIDDSINRHVTLSLDDGSSFELTGSMADSEWRQVLTDRIGETDAEPDEDAEPRIIKVKLDIPCGTNYRIRLDDGTSVWLNAGTRIEYPNVFTGGERNVNLCGEAYFEVAHDPDRPFVVTTDDRVDIRVLGTRFNVSCYDDAPCTSVTLEEGAVSVSYDDRNVTLMLNQQAVIGRADHKFSVHPVEASAYSAWKNGMFDFRSAQFEDIISAMSRWYGIEFVLEKINPAEVGPVTLCVERGDDFSQVEKILRKITGLEFREEENKVYVSQ